MINIKIKEKKYWDVAQVTDMVELYPGRKRMIQAMKDLGPIIEAAGDPLLNENIKLSKDLAIFFSRFQKLFQGLRTPIRGFDIKFKEKYYIDINCFYDYDSRALYSMPLSFLPELRKKNRKLHDIMIECIKLLRLKEVPVIDHPFFDEDESILDSMGEYISSGQHSCNGTVNDPDKDKELAEKELKLYRKYKNNYSHKIISGLADIKKTQRLINRYKPVLKIESKIIEWCNMIMDAIKEPNSLLDFNEYAKENFCKLNEIDIEDIYNDGNPVEIFQVMRFTWFGCTGYLDMESQFLGEQDGNFGSIEFAHMYECHSKEDIDNARTKFLEEWGLFPEKLTALLKFGTEIIDELWGYIDNKLIVILDNNV